MISIETFNILLFLWMGLAVVIFPVLLKITVPYGRHAESKRWGPTINSRLGWFLMELNVIVVFSWLFFPGPVHKTIPMYIFYITFMLHYVNRTFIFPLQIKDNGKKMPFVIVLLGISFNWANGFFNGYWFGYLSPAYSDPWLYDPRFVLGFILFFIGMYINISSDQTLIHLRNGDRKAYYIPYGGLFKYVSSPNLFGEIIEWFGWALMTWCLPGFSFALWTVANLIPRALDHHKWYQNHFSDYPRERKAIIPFIL